MTTVALVVTEDGDESYAVTCDAHALARVVETERHATNLANMHVRRDHPGEVERLSWIDFQESEPGPWEPGTVDLTQLARYVVLLQDDPALRHTTGHAVLGAFTELLLAPDDATALTYARRLSDAADADGTRVTAHVSPF